jgi:DNA-binding CsgD family transcriptional regulator
VNAQENFTPDESTSQAAARLRMALERSRHPMLIADDQRRWVTGNTSAAALLRIAREEIPWRTMDEFTPRSELPRLEEQWEEFLRSGTAVGWYQLSILRSAPVAVEFSATANVLPARHLSVFMSPDEALTENPEKLPADEALWRPVVAEERPPSPLTEREREVITLVATGLQGGDVADRLFLSPETVKSHVQNAMGKLGAHTRAHAVAIALVTGQITWET